MHVGVKGLAKALNGWQRLSARVWFGERRTRKPLFPLHVAVMPPANSDGK